MTLFSRHFKYILFQKYSFLKAFFSKNDFIQKQGPRGICLEKGNDLEKMIAFGKEECF